MIGEHEGNDANSSAATNDDDNSDVSFDDNSQQSENTYDAAFSNSDALSVSNVDIIKCGVHAREKESYRGLK